MKREKDTIRLSASDLMRFMSCAHASALDLDYLHGRGPKPTEDSEDAELLQRHGEEHEAAHLEQIQSQGSVIEISRDLSLDDAVAATRVALERRADVIFQGALAGGVWGGWSDFLERVDRPSALGPYSYEVADTKLKRKPDPKHVLQLVLYSDLLAPMQGLEPEHAHILLGDGSRASFRLAEYAAYARHARQRLEGFVKDPWETRPIPCAACGLCRWREHCNDVWTQQDSLFRVAGITRSQVAKLEAAGVVTMHQLAGHEARVPRLAEPTFERLKLQARLQSDRTHRGPHHALLSSQPGKGFNLLPKPDDGDLFYDIEGDPFYSEDGTEGLEYLHGVWDGENFTAFWAHSRAEERRLLIELFDFFEARLNAFPNAHIYHYAPYEITALRRLCTLHGHGEALLDRWLREGKFCDLYAVVRGGIAASEPSYSIKDMEALYDFNRTGEVKNAGSSIVAYEDWRINRDSGVLAEIEDYNRLDCISTQELRDWLVAHRPDQPWPTGAPPQDAKHDEAEAEADALREALLAADLPEGRGQLLFDLCQFHDRERKPAAWAVFDAASRTSEELHDDLECLGGLTAIGEAEPEKKSLKRTYAFPEQETKLRSGSSACISLGERIANVTLLGIHRSRREVTIKIGPSQLKDDILPDTLDLLPTFAINPGAIPSAIRRIVNDQLGEQTNTAADDLLSRAAPRFEGARPLPVAPDADPLQAMIAAASAMDGTVLPVQGPPGTGKTFVTARTILHLVEQGYRVGVTSNSHEAIGNVLKGCVDALVEEGAPIERYPNFAYKGGANTEPFEVPYDHIYVAKNNDDDELQFANVVGGTAWYFSRDTEIDRFDYLFVDEAGQVSLANLVAMTNAARNVVLVGDPNQLPQVIQGAHPHPANLSCLDWILGDATTIAPERGLFLPTSRRMHPGICNYISEQFYEGRLASHPSTARQKTVADGLPEAGAYLVPVEHAGCAQESSEEIDAIRATIKNLLGGEWTNRDGLTRPVTSNDIIVVAPYNMQVNALSNALPHIRVGTVDKFQGQEAPIAIMSMTSSSAEETSRGLDFLLSRERLNVAVSRGKALSLVFASPRLLETACGTVEQMRLVNTLCALPQYDLGFSST